MKLVKKQKDKTQVVLNSSEGIQAERLVSLAIQEKVSVETLERLLNMRMQLKQERARELFFKSLSSLQASLPIIKKNKKVMNKNGTVRYAYASLDEIIKSTKEIIKKNGFSFIINADVEGNFVKAVCKVVHEYGHEEITSFKVPLDPEGFMNQPQRFASALTYAKRYAISNAFGIVTIDEDDDAINSDNKDDKKNEITPDTLLVCLPTNKNIYDDKITQARRALLRTLQAQGKLEENLDVNKLSKEEVETEILKIQEKNNA